MVCVFQGALGKRQEVNVERYFDIGVYTKSEKNITEDSPKKISRIE